MRGLWSRPQAPVLESGGLRLRVPTNADYQAWRAVREQSRDHLKPFEPRWSPEDMTQRAFAERIRRASQQIADNAEFSFFLFDMSSGAERLLGGLTLSNIRYRAACHANLGYWMGIEAANRGYMTRAVALVLPFAFNTLKMQRLHAACLPHNDASSRVLEKNGFIREGFAEKYLQIDGQWRDHVLFGLTKDRFVTLSTERSQAL